MAKKKTNTKKTTKKTSKKPAAKKSTAVKKKPAAKKSLAKKVVKEPASKKKPAAKKVTKPVAKKPVTKKPTAKKTGSKKVLSKTVMKKGILRKVTPVKAAGASGAGTTAKPGSDAAKSGRKGITIVADKKKTHRRSRPNSKAKLPPRPEMPSLFGPGSRFKGPLIPSGPKNTVASNSDSSSTSKKKKTPFTKRQLDKFKAILIRKRAEVFGDLEELESGALLSGGSGGQSKLPQHLAEQGSDSADQNLSLNLAEVDRVLIREIDAALKRIADRTYGLCVLTGIPISEARLEELPWAQHSIEAARRLEQGQA